MNWRILVRYFSNELGEIKFEYPVNLKNISLESIEQELIDDELFYQDFGEIFKNVILLSVTEKYEMQQGYSDDIEPEEWFPLVVKEYLSRHRKNFSFKLISSKTSIEVIGLQNLFMQKLVDYSKESNVIDRALANVNLAKSMISYCSDLIKDGCWQWGFFGSDGETIKAINEWPVLIKDKNDFERWRKDGKLYVPVIWFGFKDTEPNPVSIWAISDLTENWRKMWFRKDKEVDWNLLVKDKAIIACIKQLVKDNPITIPSNRTLDNIRARCPIELNENDLDVEVSLKIQEFFVKKQKRAKSRSKKLRILSQNDYPNAF